MLELTAGFCFAPPEQKKKIHTFGSVSVCHIDESSLFEGSVRIVVLVRNVTRWSSNLPMACLFFLGEYDSPNFWNDGKQILHIPISLWKVRGCLWSWIYRKPILFRGTWDCQQRSATWATRYEMTFVFKWLDDNNIIHQACWPYFAEISAHLNDIHQSKLTNAEKLRALFQHIGKNSAREDIYWHLKMNMLYRRAQKEK